MPLPSHPDADDSAPVPPQRTSRGTTVALAVVAALAVVVVVLHLTGVVGPRAG